MRHPFLHSFGREPKTSGVCSIFGIDDILLATVGGSLVSGLVGSKATNKAADASQYATDQNTALQRDFMNLVQQNTAVGRTVGNAALLQLAERYGLSLPEAQQQVAALGGTVEGAGAGAGRGANWSAYLAADPGIAQEFSRQSPGRLAQLGVSTPEEFAAWHWNNVGQNEQGRLNPYTGVRVGQSEVDPQFASYFPQATPAAAPTPTPEPVQATAQTPLDTANPQPINASSIDSQGYYTGIRPAVTPAPTYVAPTYRETEVAPLDVSLDKYQKSPDYEFQLDQGNRNILATASATGGLESGAALKALQKWGQDLAMGDYGQWRDYTTGQYNQDRAYTANRDDAFNAFGLTNAGREFDSANSTWQFGNTLNQNIYNSNRDYATSRYDTNTNALLSLAGYGQNATNAYTGAAGNSTNALAQGYFGNAQNQGNAALASAGQFNNTISNGMNALAFYYGGQNGGYDIGVPSKTGNSSSLGKYAMQGYG